MNMYVRSCVTLAALSAACSAACGQAATPAVTDPVAQTLPSATLDSYAGHYGQDGNPDAAEAVYVKDGVLMVDGERTYPQQWTAEASDRFFLRGEKSRLVFHRDASGKVTGYSFNAADGPVLSYTRVSSDATPLNHGQMYTRSEAMVPVRDGVMLHVVVLRPKGSETAGVPLPILLDRTPYGADGSNQTVNNGKPELAASGYIFVYADIRGRYGSQGQFVMNRPVVHKIGNRTDPKLVDESSDTYDTVGWLVKNLPNNNGRVGVLGVSYPGFLAMMAGVDHHPAVKAISPQAPMTDVWMGDDFFHNGAMRETYVFDYAIGLESGKTTTFPTASGDNYDYFLKYGNFAGAAAAAKISSFPTIQHVIAEPGYTQSWQDMAVQRRLGKPEVPTLETGGFFDQEDMWGTQAEYAALRSNEDTADAGHKVYLALGPWNHGGWYGAGRTLGALNFGVPTGEEYRKQIEAPFFELYLKDKPGFSSARYGELSHGRQPVAALRRVSAGERVYEGEPLSWVRQRTGFSASSAQHGRGALCERPGEPDSVPRTADSADVWQGIEMANLACGGPAVPERPQGYRALFIPGAGS